MFCDMVGSSALSTRLDPEEQRDVVSAFQSCCAAEVKLLGGTVAQFLGDGLLVYFGYPAAHEDDAERAIRAGLAIIEKVGAVATAPGVRLQVRIGIASGVVVVGDLVREGVMQENAAIGETTNLAARLQSVAAPDTVVLSPQTYRLVGALFEYRDLGMHTLKGFAEPVHVRQVLRPSKVENRFEARFVAGRGDRLFGRNEELELLRRRWGQAAQGSGRVVLITGEAGIGKSRLTRAVQDWLASEPNLQLTYHCSPYHQDSALYPIIGQLSRAAAIEREDSAEARLGKLQALLAPTSGNVEEDTPLFAALLSIPTGDRYALPKLTPQQLKERTVNALLDHMKRLAALRPVMLMFEDIHWIDPTSLELLSLAIDQVPSQPILLLATARPEFVPPWPNHRHVSTMLLPRLDRTEGEAVVFQVAGGKAMPADIRSQIIDRADGVPLFIEELTRTVLESGLLREMDDRYELTGTLPQSSIPSTLHASLLARLDRLGPVKNVAQIGAAIGREFSYALIAACAGLAEDSLNAALAQLVQAGVVLRRGLQPDARFMFKHALVQDAAYGSLLRDQRQHIHGAIARALETRFPDIAASQPEVLANHFTQAGLAEPAIDHWRKGGELALRRSAIVEAVNHLTRGIELIKLLPPSPGRDRKELDLHLPLAPAMSAMKGWAAPETVRVMTRARELLGSSGSLAEQMSVLSGLYLVHYIHGPSFDQVLGVAQQCLTLAGLHEHTEALAQAHRFMGQALWSMGEFEAARDHLKQCIDLSPVGTADSKGLRFTLSNNTVGALSYLSVTLQPMGRFEEATAAALQALGLASDPLSKATVMVAELIRIVLGANPTQAGFDANDAVNHCVKYSLANFEQWTRFHHGNQLSESGDPRRGIEIMTNAMAAARKIGANVFSPMHLGLLAVAHVKIGDLAAGLRLLQEAIEVAVRTRERFFEPELHRLRGELALRLGREEGEASFGQALKLARQQQAGLWELRAATSLAQRWSDIGRSNDARNLLAPALSRVDDGTDLVDLKRARAVLHGLVDVPAVELRA
jgi:class 3 adenylate cyclase/tetratricopeptide (TPR) repeat protein